MDSRSINDWGQACCEPHENCPRNNAPTKPTPTGDPHGVATKRFGSRPPRCQSKPRRAKQRSYAAHGRRRCSSSIATRSPTTAPSCANGWVLTVNREPLISILDIYLYPESLADKNPHFPESASQGEVHGRCL